MKNHSRTRGIFTLVLSVILMMGLIGCKKPDVTPDPVPTPEVPSDKTPESEKLPEKTPDSEESPEKTPEPEEIPRKIKDISSEEYIGLKLWVETDDIPKAAAYRSVYLNGFEYSSSSVDNSHSKDNEWAYPYVEPGKTYEVEYVYYDSSWEKLETLYGKVTATYGLGEIEIVTEPKFHVNEMGERIFDVLPVIKIGNEIIDGNKPATKTRRFISVIHSDDSYYITDASWGDDSLWNYKGKYISDPWNVANELYIRDMRMKEKLYVDLQIAFRTEDYEKYGEYVFHIVDFHIGSFQIDWLDWESQENFRLYDLNSGIDVTYTSTGTIIGTPVGVTRVEVTLTEKFILHTFYDGDTEIAHLNLTYDGDFDSGSSNSSLTNWYFYNGYKPIIHCNNDDF